MRRLSNLQSTLKPAYDVVVVGSGYGGSIAASRMARCGLKVCLLEKGKEFLPGEFPSSPVSAAKEMHVSTAKKQIGSGNGLFDFVIGKDISVLKGCGLGGTSLINANVSIEADKRVFDDSLWPKALQEDWQGLEFGIARARDMLRPNPYPEGQAGFDILAKTEGMRRSAKAMGEPFKMADINVNFKDQVNHVGILQKKCNRCGDCVTGCNNGSKNTTQMNYLPDAENHGAEIFTEVDVRYVKKQADEWLVFFDLCGAGREKFDAPPLFVRAKKVFLSAGSLGSTEILLRSAQKGLSVSAMLGQRFTGNGDVLGFGYNCDVPLHGIGKIVNEGEVGKVGPCITSIIDMRNKEKLEEGMTLEEGSIPAAIGKLVLASIVHFTRLFGVDTDRSLTDFFKEKWRELQSLVRGPYYGALNNTQVYLVMAHDDSSGKMSLKNDRINISWKGLGKQKIFKQVGEKLHEATKALGGAYVKNPTFTKLLDYDLVTVHPLGGCVMGDSAENAVVDHKGEVFSGTMGKSLHQGLYVMDGAIIPRSVGTNPLLTISGLAERNCRIIAKEMSLSLDYAFPEIAEKVEPTPTTGLQFTEKMSGFFSLSEHHDFKETYKVGKDANSPLDFTLTIQTDDIDRFIKDKKHEATMLGTVNAPALSESALSVSSGHFNLFVQDNENAEKKRMDYRMQMHSQEGEVYYFEGYKDIFDNKGLDVWQDTTVLYVSVFSGENNTGKLLGKGMLKIKPTDFARQMTTMKALHASSTLDGVAAVAKFGRLFAGQLWETYVV